MTKKEIYEAVMALDVPSSEYGWLITKDKLAEDLELEDNDTGIHGPRGCSKKLHDALLSGRGHKFKMYDDDGVLYYKGLFIGDPDSEEGFAPLDDFGMPNAGCTRIDYYDANLKRYVTL
jgi:hypothetical protein